MKKAINLERADGRRIQINADDIQYVEEASSEGKTNVMIRHFGQVTVSSDFIEVTAWLDMLYGRQELMIGEGPPEVPDEAEQTVVTDDGTEHALPLHSDRSRKSVLGMIRRTAEDGHADPSANP